METTTAFISAALKLGEITSIFRKPPYGVDLGLGSNGLPRAWKLCAALEGIVLLQCAGLSPVVFPFGSFVGIDILWGRDACKMYLSQAALIDRLLEQEFAGIMHSDNLTSNYLCYNPGKELHKWEQLCPCSTLFDYKMPKLSLVDSPAQPDLAPVHWVQIAVGTLMFFLNSRPDLTHSIHQVAVLFIIWALLMPKPLIISCVIWQGLEIFV